MRILRSLSFGLPVVGFLLPVPAFGGNEYLPNAKPDGEPTPRERRGVTPGDADSDDQIDIANDGDFIMVNPGVYTGVGNYNVNCMGKAVTIKGWLNEAIGPCGVGFDATGGSMLPGNPRSCPTPSLTSSTEGTTP